MFGKIESGFGKFRYDRFYFNRFDGHEVVERERGDKTSCVDALASFTHEKYEQDLFNLQRNQIQVNYELDIVFRFSFRLPRRIMTDVSLFVFDHSCDRMLCRALCDSRDVSNHVQSGVDPFTGYQLDSLSTDSTDCNSK